MQVCVAGLWHLGSVTAACLADVGHDVIGFDEQAAVVENLGRGQPPLFEPGLPGLVAKGIASGRLRLTTSAAEAVASADVLWITYDTPVNESDVADTGFVLDQAKMLLPHLKSGSVVLISSQLPVGSTRALEKHHTSSGKGTDLIFAYSPENLRLGKAIDVFRNPDRVIVGVDAEIGRSVIGELLAPITKNVIFMSVESAEMTKHAINAFLAMSVAFANEIAVVCEKVGANAFEVAAGLKSERRIGPEAYVSPGVAFSGGTLARDVAFVSELSEQLRLDLSLIPSVKSSNSRHRAWPANRLDELLGGLAGKQIAMLGLTYKPDTDTLRRSYALELARMLWERGARLRAYDPRVTNLPGEIAGLLDLATSVPDAIRGADGVVITTEWPEFREQDWRMLVSTMANPVVVDPKGHLRDQMSAVPGVTYAVVGATTAGQPSSLEQHHG